MQNVKWGDAAIQQGTIGYSILHFTFYILYLIRIVLRRKTCPTLHPVNGTKCAAVA
jgi:hypothetical protein